MFGPPDHGELLEAVRAALPETEFANAWKAGDVMILEQAIEYALVAKLADRRPGESPDG